jgi:hypothetical protein
MADISESRNVASDTLDAYLSTKQLQCHRYEKNKTKQLQCHRSSHLAVYTARGSNHGVGRAVVQRAPYDDARQISAEYELTHRLAAAPHYEGATGGGGEEGLVKEAWKNVRVLETVIVVGSW